MWWWRATKGSTPGGEGGGHHHVFLLLSCYSILGRLARGWRGEILHHERNGRFFRLMMIMILWKTRMMRGDLIFHVHPAVVKGCPTLRHACKVRRCVRVVEGGTRLVKIFGGYLKHGTWKAPATTGRLPRFTTSWEKAHIDNWWKKPKRPSAVCSSTTDPYFLKSGSPGSQSLATGIQMSFLNNLQY